MAKVMQAKRLQKKSLIFYKMTNIAIIPARKNSKGVPGKNKRLLNGIPLFAHSIDFALKSNVVDKIVLNTDDEDITKYCSENYENLEIHIRSESLARDETSMVDVLMDYIKTTSCKAAFIILLQPTSPIRYHDDLVKMINLIESDSNIDCVTTVSEVPRHWSPYLMFQMSSERLVPLVEKIPTRRQDVPESYIRNGQIYVFRISSLMRTKKIITDNTYGVVSSLKGVNIDSEDDWNYAVGLFKNNH